MKKLLKQYKPVIKFITLFIVVYVVLSLLYDFYLNSSKTGQFYPDFFTHISAEGSKSVLQFLGYDVRLLAHNSKPFLKLILEDNYLARVIEGCNSISVIILFIAFVVSFSSSFKKTALYIISGSVLIFVVNIIRIAILTLGIYHFPNLSDVLHTVIFPGIIYGLVFLLWVLWIYKFSGLNKRHG